MKHIAMAVLALSLFAAGCGSDQTTRSADGDITEAGELGVFSVQVGDCVNVPEADQLFAFDGVTCTETHDAQVFALFDVIGFEDYPGEVLIEERADDGCLARFEGFVGIDYDNSKWYLNRITPSVESWESGDREVICVLVPPEGEVLDADLRNVAT